MRNVIFIPALNNAPDNIEYFRWSLESWFKWASDKDVEIVLLEEPLTDVSLMKPTWQRWYVFSLLENSGIRDYENVLLVDGDTLIHPHAPNIFDDVDFINKSSGTFNLFAVHDDLMVDWVYHSIAGYSKFWPNSSLNWTNYFNCGFVIVHKEHAALLNEITRFYETNRLELQDMQHRTLRKGSDQTPVNYIFKNSNFPITFLDKRWNCTHLHQRGFLTKSFSELGYVYHFNGFDKTQRASLMKTFWQDFLKPLI